MACSPCLRPIKKTQERLILNPEGVSLRGFQCLATLVPEQVKHTSGTKRTMGSRMRVKIWEIVLSAVMTVHGIDMIYTNDFEYRGFPIPEWAAYAYALAGIAIPILAWYLRSPSRNKKTD